MRRKINYKTKEDEYEEDYLLSHLDRGSLFVLAGHYSLASRDNCPYNSLLSSIQS